MQTNDNQEPPKKNLTHLLPQFLKELQTDCWRGFISQRLLRHNYNNLQVFCTIRRRMIVSRNFYLSKGNPHNKRIEKAFLTNNYLIITLRLESQKNLTVKVVDLHKNTDVAEFATTEDYTAWVELVEYSNSQHSLNFFASSRTSIDWIVDSRSQSNK